MVQKRRFPGTLDDERRQFLMMKIAADKKEEAEKEAKMYAGLAPEEVRYKKLLKKFASNIGLGDVVAVFGLVLAINWVVGCFDRIVSDFYVESDENNKMVFQCAGTKTKDAIKEAYVPYFHGETQIKTYVPYFHDETQISKTTNNGVNNRWKRHISLLAIEAFILAAWLLDALSKNRRSRDDIAVMLEIEKQAKRNNIKKETLIRMMSVAPEIVSHMSSESRTYFDILMSGDMDFDTDPYVLSTAKAILEGHLDSHPEDMRRVLATFKKDSLPRDIMKKFGQKVL